MTVPCKSLLLAGLQYLLLNSYAQAAPTPQQIEASSRVAASSVISADATVSSTASAGELANVTSGISNGELIGYAAAGIAALLAIAVGGVYYKKRRRRKQADKDKSANGQSDFPSKESFESLRASRSGKEDQELGSPVVDRNLAGRGTMSNSKSDLAPVGLSQVRKAAQGRAIDSDLEDDAQPQKPRRARRPKRKAARDRKRQEHSDSSETATDFSTDESVANKRR